MPVCPSCGEANPERFRFCGVCGTQLGSTPAAEVRKTVTIVFSDLVGSTPLGERLDSESLREMLGLYFERMKSVLERHGGTVEKYIGDAVMAVFGLPRQHEDDALRAVRAAWEMNHELADLNDELESTWGLRLVNRTGVHTGEVVAGNVATGQRLVTGDPVNTAARLEQAAPSGETLIGEATWRLVRAAVEAEPVEPLTLKGKAETVPAYLLMAVKPDVPSVRRMEGRMVGRRRELEALHQELDRVIEDRRCRLVTLMGTAGLGKSRLVAEFLAATSRGAKALRGRCLSYGEGITFWPLAEVAKEAALISEQDTAEEAMRKLTAAVGTDLDAPLVAERIASVIGLSGVSHALQETFWAARKFLEALARDWPLVVVFDDIHWAESTLLDMIEHLVEFGDAPVLLVCAARPELLEARPGWGRDLDLASTITLRPLSEDESDEMLRSILGGVELPPEARAGMMAAAGGNPLFVEQILAMWIDQGLLRPEGGRFVLSTSVPEHPIPATISALLGARLDRLSREERDLIERASVVGLVFYGGAVVELSREETRGRVWRDLVSLVDKDLVHPDDSTFTGEDAYRFSHVLIRDAAYAGILKRVRADLHERFAAWLERVSGDRARELEEIVGYHLEQAFRYRTELRPTMPDDHALAARASERLASAGMRASARSDTGAVANLLSRAADLLPADEPRRLELLPDLAFALTEIGEYERARALIADAAEKAAAAGDRRLEAHAIMARLLLLEDTEPEGWPERTRHEIEGVFRSLHEAGDHLGLAKAWGVMTSVHWWEGRYDLAAEATLREVEFARKAGAEHLEVRALANYCFAAFYGTTPVVEAIERCEALLDRAKTLPRLRHAVLFSLAGLKAMAGEFDRARELAAKIRPMAVDLGMRINAATASQSTAFVEMLAGNPRGAEQELTDDYRALEALGEKVYLATIAAMLAECLYTQGRHDEAGAYAEISEKGAAPDDLDVQARWRGVRAKLLARAGRFEEADRLAREAVEITTRMDFPNAHGDALLDLCEVLHLAGRMDDAMAAASEGRAAYERKGNVSSAQRALSSIERMPGAGTRTGPPGS